MDECDYCLKHVVHGGNCPGKSDGKLCIMFERDPRGVWVRVRNKITVSLGREIPNPDSEIEVTINGVDKTLKIYKIHKIEWAFGPKGMQGLTIHFSGGYWSDENGVVVKRPELRLVKKE